MNVIKNDGVTIVIGSDSGEKQDYWMKELGLTDVRNLRYWMDDSPQVKAGDEWVSVEEYINYTRNNKLKSILE